MVNSRALSADARRCSLKGIRGRFIGLAFLATGYARSLLQGRAFFYGSGSRLCAKTDSVGDRGSSSHSTGQRPVCVMLNIHRQTITMTKRRLPIGTSSFRTMRKDDCYYVDKTIHIHKLVNEGYYYFLSRPRRFGKSLLVDTLHELFAGSEELFRGLYIHDRWDWEAKHPVVRLSFDGKYSEPGELEKDIIEQLEGVERQYGLDAAVKSDSGPRRLRNIVERLYRKTGQTVVVLVDEYDKPILETLENRQQAEENRDELRGFYGMIKGCARYIRFVFVTGISMYSKVSLFSNLNNLNDISLLPHYATICGYTDTELERVFEPELAELQGAEREEIQRWYNGYHWLGEETVYNPFDILLYFQSRGVRTVLVRDWHAYLPVSAHERGFSQHPGFGESGDIQPRVIEFRY